jgi:hypothetical protein
MAMTKRHDTINLSAVERALAAYDDGTTCTQLGEDVGVPHQEIGLHAMPSLVQMGHAYKDGEVGGRTIYRLTDEWRARYGYGPLVPVPPTDEKEAEWDRQDRVRAWQAAITEALRLTEDVFADLSGQGDGLAMAVRGLYVAQAELEAM